MRGEAMRDVSPIIPLPCRAPFYGRGAKRLVLPNYWLPHDHLVTRSGHPLYANQGTVATPHLSTSAGHSAFDTHDQRARAHPSTDSGQTRNADQCSVARMRPFTSRAKIVMPTAYWLPDSPLRRAAKWTVDPSTELPLGPLFPVRPPYACNPTNGCRTTYSGDSPC